MTYEMRRICCDRPESYTSSVSLRRSDFAFTATLYFIAGWNILGSVSGGEGSYSNRDFGLSSGRDLDTTYAQV